MFFFIVLFFSDSEPPFALFSVCVFLEDVSCYSRLSVRDKLISNQSRWLYFEKIFLLCILTFLRNNREQLEYKNIHFFLVRNRSPSSSRTILRSFKRFFSVFTTFLFKYVCEKGYLKFLFCSLIGRLLLQNGSIIFFSWLILFHTDLFTYFDIWVSHHFKEKTLMKSLFLK